ncbi:MAG: hypothetical protein JEZ09_21090 [Salinivirgaceae bacterium]|nr:hypothetical protein [Salinivirgaceae bacterium]
MILNIGLGVLLQMIVASKFGASAEKDAFDTAFLIPSTIMYFTGLDIFRQTGTTFFSRLSAIKELNVSKIFSSLFLIILIGSIIISVVASLFASQLVVFSAPGLDETNLLLAEKLLIILLFTLPPLSLSAYLSSIQNAYYFFGSAEIGQVVSKTLPIVGLLWFPNATLEFLAWFQLSAAYISLLVQYFLFRRTNLHLSFHVGVNEQHVRDFFYQSRYLIVGTASTQIVRMYVNNLASQAGDGIIATLNYAMMLNFLFVALVGRPLGRVVGPSLIRSIVKENKSESSIQAYDALKLAVWISTPIIVFVMIFRFPIIKILFERGEFGADAVKLTANFFLVLSFGAIAQNISSLLGFTLLTNVRSKATVIMHLSGSVFHALFLFFGINFVGILAFPLSFAMTAFYKCIFVIYYLYSILHIKPFFGVFRWVIRQSLLMVVLSLFLLAFKNQFLCQVNSPLLNILLIVACFFLSMIIYLLLGYFFGVPETQKILLKMKKTMLNLSRLRRN